jgi:hypothetical protein
MRKFSICLAVATLWWPKLHATVSDQRCYEIAHTVLVAGTFSGFISGTKISTQLVCNEQFYESVFGSSSSQRRLIIQVHLCILYDCNKYYRINRQVVVFAYIYGDIPHPLLHSVQTVSGAHTAS